MRDTLNLQSEWAQERGAIEQEVSRDQSNAFFRFYEKALAALFAGTPYAHDPLGTRPSFQKTTGAMLRSFYTRWYAPNNAVLVIAGDVIRSARSAKCVRFSPRFHAARYRRARRPGCSRSAPSIRSATSATSPFRSRSWPIACRASSIPISPRPTWRATCSPVRAAISSPCRLKEKPWPRASSSSRFPMPAWPTRSSPRRPAAIPRRRSRRSTTRSRAIRRTAFRRTWSRLAKRREIAQLQYACNSIDGLATQWSDALTVQGLESPDDAAARYAKVTPDDVARAMKTYLRRDLAVAGILTPQPGAAPGGGGGFGVRDTFSSKNAKPVALPSWAARLNAPPAIGASLLDPRDQTLPNGIRLIVQPESVSPTVTLRGIVRHNRYLQEPAGKEGTDDLLSGLFAYGTTSADRLAYQAQLDAIAADVSAGTSFDLSVPSVEFRSRRSIARRRSVAPRAAARGVRDRPTADRPGAAGRIDDARLSGTARGPRPPCFPRAIRGCASPRRRASPR